jgi:hypothetical protein
MAAAKAVDFPLVVHFLHPARPLTVGPLRRHLMAAAVVVLPLHRLLIE